MNTKIIYALAAIIVIGGGGFLAFKFTPATPEGPAPIIDQNMPIEWQQEATTTSQTPVPPPQGGFVALRDQAWIVLNQYLAYAKAKNIEGLKTVSYQLSDSCKNYTVSEENKKDCDAKMETVAFLGQELKKERFIYTWSDKKQIILATDFRNEENDVRISKSRGIVYFVIDSNGSIKLLSFNHAKGAFIDKANFPKEQWEERLTTFTADKDEDGKEDYLETCSSATQIKGCVKTDPTKKDTNGNGWWDGIEVLFY